MSEGLRDFFVGAGIAFWGIMILAMVILLFEYIF